MEIKYWAGTDVGRKRSDNEDNFLIDKRLKLFVVADGMGGHASGEIASAVAVHGVREVIDKERDILDTYDDDDPRSHVEVCTLLEYAVHHTCESIFQKARREPEKRGMGTTLVALLVIGARGFIAYVGDSRIYLLRGGIVYQLTEDHSLKNELIRMGKITADEFDSSPYANLKNAMTRAVGVYESVEVDTLDFDIIPGDSFLLCSDGLYEYLSEDDIANSIGLPQLREIPGQLIDAANSRGGKDNITAVVVQVVGDDDDDRAAELNFTLDTLKNVPLFHELSYQQLVRVMNLSKQSPMEPGQVLFNEGDVGHELIVVLRGRIELTHDGVAVAQVQTGDHLGEMALIDAGLRSATAVALESGKVLKITRDDFYDVLRREPALAVKLLWSFVRVLADRLRTTTADLASARSTVETQFLDITALAEDAARKATPRPIEKVEEVEEVLAEDIEPEDLDEIDEIDEVIEEPEPEDRPTMVSGTLSRDLEERRTIELPAVRKQDLERRTTLISSTTTTIDPSAPSRAPRRPPSGPDLGAPGPSPKPARRSKRERETLPAVQPPAELLEGDAAVPRERQSSPVNTGDTVVPPSNSRRQTAPAGDATGARPPNSAPGIAAGVRRNTEPAKAAVRASTPAQTGNTVVPPSAIRRNTEPANPRDALDPPSALRRSTEPSNTGDTVVPPSSTPKRRKTEPSLPVDSLPTPRPDPDVTRPLDAAWPPSVPSAPVPAPGRAATVPVEVSRGPVGVKPPVVPSTTRTPRPNASATPGAVSPPRRSDSGPTPAPSKPAPSKPAPPKASDASEADAPQPRRAPRRNTLRSMPGPPTMPAADLSETPGTQHETLTGLPPVPGGTAPSQVAESADEPSAPPDHTHVGMAPLPVVPPPPTTRTSSGPRKKADDPSSESDD